jgi:hypothetical protein
MSLLATATRVTAAILFLSLLLPALAQAESECTEWFPDLNCEGREGRYEGFSTTNSMPYLFEDPFITTNIFAHAIWHEFPDDSALRAGELYVLAVQARLAITDRLAFIATKDGYAWLRPGRSSEIPDDDGFFDIAAGFKYALIDRPEDGYIVTPSFRIDIPVGNNGMFSGNGDGVAIPAVSGAFAAGPIHLIGSFGARLPFNTGKEASSVFYNLHVDAGVAEFVVPFIELNGTTWTRSANGGRRIDTKSFGSVPIGVAQNVLSGAGVTDEKRFEGLDVANLGSEGVSGTTIMSLAFGARVPVNDNVSIGGYYEIPITARQGLFERRAEVNVLFEF